MDTKKKIFLLRVDETSSSQEVVSTAEFSIKTGIKTALKF